MSFSVLQHVKSTRYTKDSQQTALQNTPMALNRPRGGTEGVGGREKEGGRGEKGGGRREKRGREKAEREREKGDRGRETGEKE